MRRTKILATLGPSTDEVPVLENLLLNGVNVVRLNFSHGSADDHQRRAAMVREIASKHGLNVALLADLQGPKIRIGTFKDSAVEVASGQEFVLDTELANGAGDALRVGVDYKALHEDCSAQDILLLDDGRISMRVTQVIGSQVHCEVLEGGCLSNNKGINRRGGGLSAPALTEKDKVDIQLIADIGFDYVAVSFPKTKEDIDLARGLLRQAGSQASVIAKIERAEAALDNDNLCRIIEASDAVMVARGDLGVEIRDGELPAVQKKIVLSARKQNRLVIVATQMMESMISSPTPTRAEVFDVANAVLDGADAVMLSAETAAGKYPVKAVHAMSNICLSAEKNPQTRKSHHRINRFIERSDEAIAMASMYTANHLVGVRAIVSLTESGATPIWMSRIRSGIPILALTRSSETQRRLALARGIEAYLFDATQYEYLTVNENAIQLLRDQNVLDEGDIVIFTKGSRMGKGGLTNAMQIISV